MESMLTGLDAFGCGVGGRLRAAVAPVMRRTVPDPAVAPVPAVAAFFRLVADFAAVVAVEAAELVAAELVAE